MTLTLAELNVVSVSASHVQLPALSTLLTEQASMVFYWFYWTPGNDPFLKLLISFNPIKDINLPDVDKM